MEKLGSLCTIGGNIKWFSCLKKLKVELPYDPVISLLGLYLKELKAGSQRYLHSHVHSSIIDSSQEVKARHMSLTDKWINKIWCIHTME